MAEAKSDKGGGKPGKTDKAAPKGAKPEGSAEAKAGKGKGRPAQTEVAAAGRPHAARTTLLAAGGRRRRLALGGLFAFGRLVRALRRLIPGLGGLIRALGGLGLLFLSHRSVLPNAWRREPCGRRRES